MSNTGVMAWRFLRTDWRSGELYLLFMALLLSVTIVTGLTAFVDRLQLMLAGESSQFLAADRVLTSPRPVDDAWLEEASMMGLRQASYLSFQSMLYVGDDPLLVSVKAASSSYPLIGEIILRDNILNSAVTDLYRADKGPEAGEIWAESRLLQQLNLTVGQSVYVGDAELALTKVLVSEPDRGVGAISMGPRVLMHLDDVPATGVVQVGSRLKYAYLFAGDAKALNSFEDELLPKISASQRWLDLENSQPTVALSLARAKSFFLLASSIVIVLAAMAVAMASTRYCQRHVKHIAVLKTLGATSVDIRNIYLCLLLMLFVAVLLLGWFLAFILQHAVLTRVAMDLQVSLPSLGVWPFFMGALAAFISLMAFTLPPIYRLKSIPAVRIFQQFKQQDIQFSVTSLMIATLGLLGLLLLYTEQLLLSILLMVALLILVALISIPAFFVLRRFHFGGAKVGGWWSMAISNLRRRIRANTLQLSLFSISLMLLVVLLGVRDNLFTQWQNQLPAETPNFFLLNLQQREVDDVTQWLQQSAAKSEILYPMIRGRLVLVNGDPVQERVSQEAFKRSGADRELNLSWASTLPVDNTIVEGQWLGAVNVETRMPADMADVDDLGVTSENADVILDASLVEVSIESQLAKRLQIQLGDRLTFMLAAQKLEARVSSIRKVDWDKMRPNFYVLFPESALRDFPKTFMTSFYLAEEKHQLVTELLKRIPTAIVIEIDSVIKQIRSIVHHVSMALQLVLVFVVIGAVLVMIATVQNSLDSRQKENTVIRALGGSRALITGSLIAEFFLLGLLSGVLATVAAELVLMAIQQWVMFLPVRLNPSLWWIAPLMGSVIITIAGWLAARRVTKVAPMQLLRVHG